MVTLATGCHFTGPIALRQRPLDCFARYWIFLVHYNNLDGL